MKIMLMGGTGFIGRRLLKRLVSGSDEIMLAVRAESVLPDEVDASSYQTVNIAYQNEKDIESALAGVDTVVYLIGQMGGPNVTYEQFYESNCTMTKRVLTAAGLAGVTHFIYCSTPGVIGFGHRLGTEEEAYAPRNDYEKTKVFAEELVMKIAPKYHMHYTIIRPDFVYGPGDYRRVPMYKSIMKKHFVLTTSGMSHLHPTYVEDVVSGFMCCIGNENAYDDIFNIAAEYDATVYEYLHTIADAVGSELIHFNITYYPSVIAASVIDKACRLILKKEGFVTKNKIDFLAMDHSSSIKKAQKKIGYKPEYDCQRGLNETIAWCKDNHLL